MVKKTVDFYFQAENSAVLAFMIATLDIIMTILQEKQTRFKKFASDRLINFIFQIN